MTDNSDNNNNNLENSEENQELNQELDNVLDEAVSEEPDTGADSEDKLGENSNLDDLETDPDDGYTVTDDTADSPDMPEANTEPEVLPEDTQEPTPPESEDQELSSEIERAAEPEARSLDQEGDTGELDIDALGKELEVDSLNEAENKSDNNDNLNHKSPQASEDLQKSDSKLDQPADSHPLDGDGQDPAGTPKKHSKIKITIFSIIALLVLVAGGELIYSVFSKSAREFEVNLSSTPAGATVIIDGKEVGLSPIKIKLKAGKHKVEFQRNGYAPIDEMVIVDKDGKVISKELKPSSDSKKSQSN